MHLSVKLLVLCGDVHVLELEHVQERSSTGMSLLYFIFCFVMTQLSYFLRHNERNSTCA